MSSPYSKATGVDAYLAEASEFARPICAKLREIVRKEAPDLEECLKWGAPSYKGKGLVCTIGAFKQHVTMFFYRGAELKDASSLLQHGEGNAFSRSVKFTSLAEVKAAALTALVKQTVNVDATEKPVKEKAKRAELPVPPVLSAALKKNARARKTFEGLSPSCRREYCEWIGGAKQAATVQRRLEKALVMLAEGRKMNEEYR